LDRDILLILPPALWLALLGKVTLRQADAKTIKPAEVDALFHEDVEASEVSPRLPTALA
jgi:hypothetical protein